jgi:hypothetical protein
MRNSVFRNEDEKQGGARHIRHWLGDPYRLDCHLLRGGSAILSKTALSGVDSTNPYGVAFFAALVGLFMDYFYAYLGTIVPKG